MMFSNLLSFCLTVAAVSVSAAPISTRSHSAKATYFYQNGNPGSCGNWNSDDAYIVAVSGQHHSSSNCGKTLHISSGGNSIDARIADTCPTCDYYDLDLSVGAFQALGAMDQGVLDIEWYMM